MYISIRALWAVYKRTMRVPERSTRIPHGLWKGSIRVLEGLKMHTGRVFYDMTRIPEAFCTG